ncbi:uncharacterized protein LOC113514221 [Galleria mellonella]|uniref:Uncharacterized protein LOC113514221 n=1 Tax=Galleria mellonella TaxID=7137 RepID=A0A6J1WI55_GALME|nr:uncharacterized protein LOC113514221 [Galleria mellonella]
MTVNGESHQNNFTYNYMEDDDNTVNVTCVLAKSPESMMTYDIQMIEGFGNFSTINSSISTLNRNFKLGINHNGTNIRCILIDHDNKEEIATIFMTLNITTPNKNKVTQKPATSKDTSSELIETSSELSKNNEPNSAQNGQLWLWILIICACVILIFITLSIIKAIKKYFRTLRQSNTEYENLTSQNTQPFPNSSTLEATYCSPADLKSSGSENIYAQPYKPKNPEDLYSIPIPKSKRKNPPAESLYAELAFHNKNDQIDSRNLGRNEKEPEYACIKKAPNANDKQKQASSTDYTNVFEKDRYVNSKDQEYVEPSYYEVGHR